MKISFFFPFCVLNFKGIVPLLNPATHQDDYQVLAHFQQILNSIITKCIYSSEMNAHRSSLSDFKNIIDKPSWQILGSNKQENNQQQQNSRKQWQWNPRGGRRAHGFLRRLRKLACFFFVAMFVNFKVCNIWLPMLPSLLFLSGCRMTPIGCGLTCDRKYWRDV